MSLGAAAHGAVLLGGLLLVPACGYRLAARPALPGGIDRVRVEMLTNETSELEIGAVASAALSRRVAQDDRLATGTAAAAVLRGRVLQPRTRAAAFPARLGGAGLYTLSLTLDVELRSPHGKRLARARVSADEPFEAGAGPEETESNRRRALRRLSERLADEAWQALTAAGGRL